MNPVSLILTSTIWIVIPIAVLALKGFREFLRFRTEQRKLGTSTHELESRFADMQRINARLVDRVENLEAIVASQTWEAVNAAHSSASERELRVASAAHREMAPPDPGEVNQQRLQQLAQRLGR